jgi:hypothetical protein
VAEYFTSKRSLSFWDTCLDLIKFGNHLTNLVTIQSFEYEREKTKLIGLLPGMKENASLKEVSIGGNANYYKEWISLLQCMLQHTTLNAKHYNRYKVLQ